MLIPGGRQECFSARIQWLWLPSIQYTVHVFRSGERKRAQQANCSHHGVGAGIVHTGDHSIGASVDAAQSCPFDIGLIGFRGCLLSCGQRGEPGGSISWLGNRQRTQKVSRRASVATGG